MSKLDLINKYLKDELRDIEFDDVILKKKSRKDFSGISNLALLKVAKTNILITLYV
ncbi:Uncharacterised protein [Providencia stuartii]|nr:Uncharacterised protein [Providencia stuartii]